MSLFLFCSLCKTYRFHVTLGLFSNRSQKTSRFGYSLNRGTAHKDVKKKKKKKKQRGLSRAKEGSLLPPSLPPYFFPRRSDFVPQPRPQGAFPWLRALGTRLFVPHSKF